METVEVRGEQWYIYAESPTLITLRPVESGIRGQRRILRLSQLAYAEKLGISQSYLSKIEQGIVPITEAVKLRIAKLRESKESE